MDVLTSLVVAVSVAPLCVAKKYGPKGFGAVSPATAAKDSIASDMEWKAPIIERVCPLPCYVLLVHTIYCVVFMKR